MLENKKELVQKYKALVNVNTTIKVENADLLAELNQLKMQGGGGIGNGTETA